MIVIDSSDEVIEFIETYPFLFKYIHTNIKSAARQRNIGLIEINENCHGKLDYIAFLDDDTRIESDYFKKVRDGFLILPEAVGISGITQSNSKPKNIFMRKLFGLYQEPGKISKGGVNVPIESEGSQNRYFETNWLIGCSVWRYESTKGQRFQEDFQGQSLFEDVIFSFQHLKIGKLFVFSSIRLTHLQSPIERPDSFKHSHDWVKNRYRLFELFEDDFHKRDFWIANVGKLIYECITLVRHPKSSKIKSILGLVAGSLKVIFN